MKYASAVLLCLLSGLAVCLPCRGQEPRQGPVLTGNAAPCGSACGGLSGLHWTVPCFPRCGCADDYCPHPYPRPCWPPYPPFYKCVPAGDCSHPIGGDHANNGLSWWFLPTPRALREALWARP
jgi:hypothetical protein